MSETRPLVLYHGPNCADGFGAALSAYLRYGEGADYLSVQYNEPPPETVGRDVIILDFSYPRRVLEEIVTHCKTLVLIDHHRTAMDDLTPVDAWPTACTILFDMAHSGARLAWDYFWPERKQPPLIDYLEARDLWKFDLPSSREVSAAIASYPFDFGVWKAWMNYWPDTYASFVVEGTAILRYQQKVVSDHVKFAREVEIAGHKVLAVNATTMTSEIAGELAKDRPFGVCWFQRSDGRYIWSFRSREGGVDVSEIAKSITGGGHRAAAGCERDCPP